MTIQSNTSGIRTISRASEIRNKAILMNIEIESELDPVKKYQKLSKLHRMKQKK